MHSRVDWRDIPSKDGPGGTGGIWSWSGSWWESRHNSCADQRGTRTRTTDELYEVAFEEHPAVKAARVVGG